jgi:hypothetical protein
MNASSRFAAVGLEYWLVQNLTSPSLYMNTLRALQSVRQQNDGTAIALEVPVLPWDQLL